MGPRAPAAPATTSCGHSYGGVVALLAAAAFPQPRLADGDRAAGDARGARGAGGGRVRGRRARALVATARMSPRRSCAPSSRPSARVRAARRRYRPSSSREHARSCASAGPGRPRSRSPLCARRRSRSSSCRAPITPRSTPSATRSSAGSTPSTPSLAGAGHSAQAAPGFNDVLVDFLERAARPLRQLVLKQHKLKPSGARGRLPRARRDARVRELHDLEQVDDVDREGERDERRSRRPRASPTRCQSPPSRNGTKRVASAARRASRTRPTSSAPRAAARSRVAGSGGAGAPGRRA